MRTFSSGKHSCTWSFLHAALAFPILGANFLQHFNFMVDIKNKRLVGTGRSYVQLSAPQASLNLIPVGVVANNSTMPAGGARQPQAGVAGGAQQPQAASLCAQPPAAVISTAPLTQASVAAEILRVLTASKKLPPVRHKVEHVIETTCSRPVTSRYCRLDPEKLEVAKREFAEMEAQGIVVRSSSSWASPCGHHQLLILATKPDL